MDPIILKGKERITTQAGQIPLLMDMLMYNTQVYLQGSTQKSHFYE